MIHDCSKFNPKGMLIVLEGPDGSGKTTLAGKLVEHLTARGYPSEYHAFPGREAGTLGELVYRLHHTPGRLNVGRITSTSLQVLHIAAHIDAIERTIQPALSTGRIVVLDRFWWSTWVYGVASRINPKTLQRMIAVEVNEWRGLLPTIVLLVRRQKAITQSLAARQLAREYERIALAEAAKHPVVTIDNDGEIGAALGRILDEINRTTIALSPNRRQFSKPIRRSPLFDQPVQSAAPFIFRSLSPAKPTIVYDTYWQFAAERQAVFFRRFVGDPPPWTNDHILREHKFTNVYRASDRVSQYLIRHVIYRGDPSPNEVFFRTLLFKFFNRIETWETLFRSLGELAYATYTFERYDAVLSRALEKGHRIYSAAYIMPSGGRRSVNAGGKKHRMHLRLLEQMMRDEVPERLKEVASMAQAFELLISYPTIGPFLAYQYITDLNYSTITNFSEMEFVVPGPGARDGIQKCFTDLGGLKESDIIKIVADRQEEEFDRLGLKFQSLFGRRLQLIDCQNLFCEVDKYARVKHPEITGITGRTRIKQKFRHNDTPINYWYPPKWGINHLIPNGGEHVPTLLSANSQ